jgi:hypothetical protein
MIGNYEDLQSALSSYWINQRELINHITDNSVVAIYEKKLARIRAEIVIYVWRVLGFHSLARGKFLAYKAVGSVLSKYFLFGVNYDGDEIGAEEFLKRVITIERLMVMAQDAAFAEKAA